MKHTFDPDLGWNRLVASQPAPTRELFDELFAAGDREKIILSCLHLIRRFNTAPKHLREDVEMFVIGEVTREVDLLLQKPNDNPGSYLIDVIRGAVYEAKFGTRKAARDCVSTNRRIYRPRPRPTDAERNALVRKLERQGQSPQMIEAELQAAGFDQSRIITNECEWPSAKVRGEDDKHYTGERSFAEFGADDPSNDDWQHLAELYQANVLNDSDMQLLDALSQGFTQNECADIFSANVSTIKARLTRIKAKVQSHEDD